MGKRGKEKAWCMVIKDVSLSFTVVKQVYFFFFYQHCLWQVSGKTCVENRWSTQVRQKDLVLLLLEGQNSRISLQQEAERTSSKRKTASYTYMKINIKIQRCIQTHRKSFDRYNPGLSNKECFLLCVGLAIGKYWVCFLKYFWRRVRK